MPIPQQFGRGDRMGRGPYEKSGLIRETSLHPHKTVTEKFDIPFPLEDVKDGDKVKKVPVIYDMTIDVELWYMPYGSKEVLAQLWKKETKNVSITKTGK